MDPVSLTYILCSDSFDLFIVKYIYLQHYKPCIAIVIDILFGGGIHNDSVTVTHILCSNDFAIILEVKYIYLQQ